MAFLDNHDRPDANAHTFRYWRFHAAGGPLITPDGMNRPNQTDRYGRHTDQA